MAKDAAGRPPFSSRVLESYDPPRSLHASGASTQPASQPATAMEEALDLMPEAFSQKELEDLAALNPELQHLHIMLQSTQPQEELLPTLSSSASGASGDGRSSGSSCLGPDSLDFSKLAFRNLRSLSLEGVPLAGLRLTADNCPALESLSISNPPGALIFFELALPQLRRLSLEGVALAPPGPEGRGGDDFAVSLGQCPNLTSFAGYRLMGLGGFHFLNLPRCAAFALLFSDDIKALDLFGPRLTALDCQACPSLVRLHLHDAPLAGPEAVRGFRAEANRVDEARSGASSVREEEAARDKEVDALVARYSQAPLPRSVSALSLSPLRWALEQKEAGVVAAAAAQAPPPAAAAAAGDGDESASSSSFGSGSDTEGEVPNAAEHAPSIQVNLLNTHLGSLSLQRLAAHPRVGPQNLEGVMTQAGALGLSKLLRVESDLNTDGAATSAGPSSSPSLTPRSLASPCSSYSSGGFAGGGGGIP